MKSTGENSIKEILFNRLLPDASILLCKKETPGSNGLLQTQCKTRLVYNENCIKSLKNWMQQVLKSGSSGLKVNVIVTMRENELRFTKIDYLSQISVTMMF